MNSDKNIENANEDICKAGYEFASILYDAFAIDTEIDQAKACVYGCIFETAFHDLEDALESVGRGGLKYLDKFDWEEVLDAFNVGILRLVDEKYPDS